MPLILPNTIANQTPADGDKVDQNFDTIVAWANQEAITRDGATAMTAPLLLPGVPTATNQAATKGYVDSAVPVGVMWAFGGDTAPVGWELCRGQALSRATYAALFAVLGTKFGAGDGSTTFNLPSMQGRSPMGHWPGGSWATTNGAMTGSADTTLPAHQHTGVDHLHGFATGGATARHDHGFPEGYFIHQTANPQFYVHVTAGGGFDIGCDIFNFATWQTGADRQDHAHTGTTGGADRSLTTGVAGSSSTNANIHPVVVCNFIIRVM